jgi:hypothetical protein
VIDHDNSYEDTGEIVSGIAAIAYPDFYAPGGSMNEDERTEIRLQQEARENYRGHIFVRRTAEQARNHDAQRARVEVTYQPSEGEQVRAGYYIVSMPYDVDPWTTVVQAKLELEWPAAAYLSVDDIYAD